MTTRRSLATAAGAGLLLLLAIGAAQGAPAAPTAQGKGQPEKAANQIRANELARLAAIVRGDAAAARPHYTPDFRGINPLGQLLSLDELLGEVADGSIDFLTLEPTSPIEVEVLGQRAVVRYQSRIELAAFGLHLDHRTWHTMLYERRGGDWRLAWDQLTAVPNNVGLAIDALRSP